MIKLIVFSMFIFFIHGVTAAEAGEILAAEKPIVLQGPATTFDFMATDPAMMRILAAHRGAKTLEIVDLRLGKPLKSIEVGAAQGVAVDAESHRYFLGNEGDHNIVIVDSQSLIKTDEIKVDGPVDAITFDDKNGILYAAKDDGDHLWAIDTKTAKTVGTVTIPGVPEVLEYDPITDRVYLNIKNKNLLVRINPTKNKVDASWSTLPATSPHGLVVDSKRGRVYTAGGNGKLVALDLKTGKAISSVSIPLGVDQIAFDVANQIIYCACKGFISIVKVSNTGLKAITKVASPKGAHTLAIDPISHDVWTSFADESHSYLQKFKLTP